MNKAGFGIVALALLAISPEVAFGQKGKQSPQKEKQIPQQFIGMWCDTGNEGDNVSIPFRRINKSEDCKTKHVLELTTGFLTLYNDDVKTTCLLVNLDSANPGKVQGKYACAALNPETKRIYTTQELYELAFERDETLGFRDMKRSPHPPPLGGRGSAPDPVEKKEKEKPAAISVADLDLFISLSLCRKCYSFVSSLSRITRSCSSFALLTRYSNSRPLCGSCLVTS